MSKKNSVQTIRKDLKALRLSKNISTSKMQLDTSTQKLYEFERGERDVKIDTLVVWCNYLGAELKITKPN